MPPRALFAAFAAVVAVMTSITEPTALAQSSISKAAVARATETLLAKHGEAHAASIGLGVRQVAERWWAEDGDEATFEAFVLDHYLADPAEKATALKRVALALEQISGHLHEVRRELTRPFDLDLGPISSTDQLLGEIDLSSHVPNDLYASKVAFLVLLNLPVHTLTDRLRDGASWDRATWAHSRLAESFDGRLPPSVLQEVSSAFSAADRYIAATNIRLDRLEKTQGERLFPEGLRLISHWGLRDELAAHYSNEGADANGQGLARQRQIYQVMRRIVRQEIPAAVIDNGDLVWNPETNAVRALESSTPSDPTKLATREADVRYEKLLNLYRAVRKADPFSPTDPTYIDRQFNGNRQVPEQEVEALLISVLESPEVRDLAKLIRDRLGRPLEPFDIWYAGFKPRSGHSEADLDALVRAKFASVEAFQAALPKTLEGLGFAPDKAKWLAERIVVDPARGAGHAMPAVRREDSVHLRTRVPAGGMDYKGYNIAIHELGHNVEQVFSLHGIDHWALSGVPNNAFTEALAFVFQHRDLELLGLGKQDEAARRAESLATLWNTYEIGGVSLVDIRVWRYLYEHPNATPAELREATVRIAREVWNAYFAPNFGKATEDSEILGIYSHMIAYGLYLPDYALGHLIAFQVAAQFDKGDFGREFERVSKLGRLTPDAWMRNAVGGPLSAQPLLEAARKAIAAEK